MSVHKTSALFSIHGRWMMFFSLLVVLQVLLWAQTGSPSTPTPQTTLDEVSEKLSCRCGCNLVLNRCNHVQCGSALPMRARINKEIAEGKTRDEIIAGFVRDMGEEVLAVPPTSGFNWNAWIMPFVVLFIGGILVILALRFMMRRRLIEAVAPASGESAASSAAPEVKASAMGDRIEKELKEFEDL
jgi:cytochrome c-type biogenesis protein CcmH